MCMPVFYIFVLNWYMYKIQSLTQWTALYHDHVLGEADGDPSFSDGDGHHLEVKGDAVAGVLPGDGEGALAVQAVVEAAVGLAALTVLPQERLLGGELTNKSYGYSFSFGYIFVSGI